MLVSGTVEIRRMIEIPEGKDVETGKNIESRTLKDTFV